MSKKKIDILFKFSWVFFCLYIFLISIGMMEASFKGFGHGFAEALISTTSNPFVGLFIGILATSLIQSSSTTTSLVVGMVSSGVLTVPNSIPIIMGANIGTSVTNTLVSLGHFTRRDEFKRAIAGATVHDFFNIICVLIFFPLELGTGMLQKMATGMTNLFTNVGGIEFTSPVKIITKPVINILKDSFLYVFDGSKNMAYILMLVLAFVFLFFSLFFIVRIMKSLVIKKVEMALEQVLGNNGIIAILAGLVFTILVQSSSITTSLLVPMIAAGILNLESAFPITLGANIGTTTTAILASFATGNISAITIAFVHFLFNVLGTVFIYPISFIRKIPLFLAGGLGELAFRKRRYAFIYVASVFFIIPGILIVISRFLK